MLERVGFDSFEALIAATIPDNIRFRGHIDLPEPVSEADALAELRDIAERNRVFRSYLGMGYYGCNVPPVIQRKVLENPAWYTAYTPYQPEISQGRLEALLNFQTVCIDLTGLPIANASLLDEGTAAAEAMAMAHAIAPGKERDTFLVSELCHPQTIEVVRTRARARRWQVVVGDHRDFRFDARTFGVLLQYPATDGSIHDYHQVIEQAHAAGALATVATDLLALTLLTPPGEFGADMVIGSSQRFGVPMGFGGPHAAFFTCRDEYKRFLPGRIIGILARRARQARAPHGAPDPRAAHPPGKGYIQYLHLPGAAGRPRQLLRAVSRAGWPARHRRAGAPACRRARRCPAGPGLPGERCALLRHRQGDRGCRAGPHHGRGRGARHQPAGVRRRLHYGRVR